MNFCSNCGANVIVRIPAGDNFPRHVCDRCGTIHYLNPKLVVGTVPQWQDRVLLCRRAIEPRRDYWTLPAGFMENNETTAEAAVRETCEEAGTRIELDGLHTLINVAHISQVHLMYRARLLDTAFAPGEESLEVALFREEEIPWRQLAFPTISLTLRLFFEDRRNHVFPVHVRDLPPPA